MTDTAGSRDVRGDMEDGMDWQLIETAPKDGTEIDVWVDVPATPLSMGIADAWRISRAKWIEGKGWCDFCRGKWEVLRQDVITHWISPDARPGSSPAADGGGE